jgi:hypothetical protein
MAEYEWDFGTPTLKSSPNFNAERDCEELHKAMKGMGCDDNVIVKIFGHRTFDERAAIKDQYKTMYGEVLEKRLISELSGNMERVVVALCRDRFTYDAELLYESMKGAGTEESILIEIICTRLPEELAIIKDIFKTKYKKSLEDFISGDTSGDFKRFLISLATAGRPSSLEPINQGQVVKDAQDLYEAGEKRWGTDETTFNRILCARSFSHLSAVFNAYRKVSGKDIEKSIENEMSGDIKVAYLTLARCIKNKGREFARRILKSMKGMGTDDDTLIRIIVSRCEVDMVQIKQEFLNLPENKKRQSMAQWIKDDTSGSYCKILLALIGEN